MSKTTIGIIGLIVVFAIAVNTYIIFNKKNKPVATTSLEQEQEHEDVYSITDDDVYDEDSGDDGYLPVNEITDESIPEDISSDEIETISYYEYEMGGYRIKVVNNKSLDSNFYYINDRKVNYREVSELNLRYGIREIDQ